MTEFYIFLNLRLKNDQRNKYIFNNYFFRQYKMLSFETTSQTNKTLWNVLYFALAAFAVWAVYYIVVNYVMPRFSPKSTMSKFLDVQSLNTPSATGSDPVTEDDFNYLHGTTMKVEGLSQDPSNDVQKFTQMVDVSGRAYWEPVPMTSVNDYLTADEYNGILDRHVLRNMTPNLKHLTMPKFIRNADNFWGTYWPNETGGPLDNGRCVDPSDLIGKQGLFQNIPM